MSQETHVDVFAQIDEWYARAPAGLPVADTVDWVQYNSEIPCPCCGELLYVLRGENAGGRGTYHLAICQNDDCDFQAAD